MESENSKLKQYLLGNLTQGETEKLDLRIISDAGLEEPLLMAEHELVEDYLEKNLSTEESELFRRNFLVGSKRESLLREVALLKRYAQHSALSDNLSKTATETAGDGFFEKLKGWFSLNLRPAAAVLTLLIAGLLIFGVWRIFLTDSMSPLEREYAALNQKDLSSPAEFQNSSSVNLVPGTFRDTNQTTKFKAAGLTENVLFRLALPAQTDLQTKYRAELSKDGTRIFTQQKIRVYQNQSGQEVRLILPKSVLSAPGQYKITLENSVNQESTVSYTLAVE